MQKIHNHGQDGRRYFWNVNVEGEGKSEYRSRHASAAGVRKEFMRSGKKVVSIKPTKA